MGNIVSFLLFFFFFSSRRRHTRFKCDSSSDVCSSDLVCRLLLEAQRADSLTRVRLGALTPSASQALTNQRPTPVPPYNLFISVGKRSLGRRAATCRHC